MRNKVFMLLMPVLVITALIVTACGEGETILITKNQCTITFDIVGASTPTPETITIVRGRTMDDKYPADPVNEDTKIVFYGWWDSGIRYEKNTVINADLDLTARWAREQDLVTVTFNTDGGSAVPAMKVLKGDPIGLRIPVSRKKNYTFDGWFNSTTEYTAAAPVINADVTVTAKWTLKPTYTVSFNTKDVNAADPNQQQSTITPVTVYEGEGLETDLPGATDVTHTDSRVKFVRWIGADNELYDEFTPIYENMTFYVKWGLDPYVVDLSQTTLVNGDGDFEPTYYPETDSKPGYVKNANMYDGSRSRWQIIYRIGLNLPADFNMGYYTRYNVRARFYGNNRAILNDPDYASGYMNDANAIQTIGDEMPPVAGYGQISWCVTPTSNGNPGQDKPGVIAQQYNLGTTTINNQWLVGGDYSGSVADALRPNYLLIQTSDNWIGWIEIYQIAFHNGEEEFLDPPTED
jgi:uncharacterized repeat protein (TIGR02543 family)